MPQRDWTEHYTVGEWKGMPKYECVHCPFDSLDEEVIREHVLKQHIAPVPQRRVVPKLVNRFGQPLTTEQPETEEVTDGTN